MVTATPWGTIPGYSSFTNSSNLSIIRGTVEAWQSNGHGVAGMLVFLGLPLLAGGLVYMKTQKLIYAVFVSVIVALVLNAYNIYNYTLAQGGAVIYNNQIIFTILTILLVLGIAVWAWNFFIKKRV